jgi:ParB family chromosome partitioning protein
MHCQKLNTYMETGRVVFLPFSAISPNPNQPRTVFAEDALTELSQSIRRHGVLQPLSVRRIEGGYQLIAGERRLRAAQLAGLTEVPCLVMRLSDRESGMVALIENLQRQDLDFIEEARGIGLLMERYGLTQEQAAQALGKSQSGIANKLRLLRHSEAVLKAIRRDSLTERHARALLKLPTDALKLQAIDTIRQLSMTAERADRYIESLVTKEKPAGKPNISRFLAGLDQSLSGFRLSGIPAISERKETDSQIVVTITIPKLQ